MSDDKKPKGLLLAPGESADDKIYGGALYLAGIFQGESYPRVWRAPAGDEDIQKQRQIGYDLAIADVLAMLYHKDYCVGDELEVICSIEDGAHVGAAKRAAADGDDE